MPALDWEKKCRALAFRFYQNSPWVPAAGDLYTTSRADLEIYRVVRVGDRVIETRYVDPSQPADTPNAVWEADGFLNEGFGVNRVWLPLWLWEV